MQAGQQRDTTPSNSLAQARNLLNRMAQKRAAGSPIGGSGRTGLESNHNAAAGLIKGAEQHGLNKIKLFFSFFSKT